MPNSLLRTLCVESQGLCLSGKRVPAQQGPGSESSVCLWLLKVISSQMAHVCSRTPQFGCKYGSLNSTPREYTWRGSLDKIRKESGLLPAWGLNGPCIFQLNMWNGLSCLYSSQSFVPGQMKRSIQSCLTNVTRRLAARRVGGQSIFCVFAFILCSQDEMYRFIFPSQSQLCYYTFPLPL